ncbi:MAG: [FeFe] hydrogenase H-cluster radical SAM maturase HydE [Candidatus Adiutrix intracellularis]|jgi:biotin synthase|nr:MAG: [FeFe] hydrogenase H-cluster radical SAM maturase HydE [Candidatus Adiutrix intracellularis]MDR2826623.1 [FeFe] hydrogenase H-cluster radical SAM maturase HydE [Candidatus Adiutrix intracellularis]
MLKEILNRTNFSRDDLIFLMKLTNQNELNRLFESAYAVKTELLGRTAYYRGLLEFSNRCRKNCFYCGIRSGNNQIERFDMTKEEILNLANWAWRNQYGSLTLQSGERNDPTFIKFVDDLIISIKKLSCGQLGLTLCLGEQTDEVFKKWFDLGAHRYLLRIETSNPRLYRRFHPNNAVHSFKARLSRLKALKRIGYQLGTGVMIALPGQTEEDLVDDILFYEAVDADMIGMGPYVVHSDTPTGQEVLAAGRNTDQDRRERLILALKMIAITRLYLRNVNIAATTALQALDPFGRELGLKAGANILMPIITAEEHRPKYLLYENKPCVGDDQEKCRDCLTSRVRSIGEEVGFSQWGDSPHATSPYKATPKIDLDGINP